MEFGVEGLGLTVLGVRRKVEGLGLKCVGDLWGVDKKMEASRLSISGSGVRGHLEKIRRNSIRIWGACRSSMWGFFGQKSDNFPKTERQMRNV